MQNAALRAARIDLCYEALDVAPPDLGEVLRRLVREGAAGNVTIPHKAAVAAVCARVSRVAERAGAVNTFWTEGGLLVGDNTDVAGFDTLASRLLGGRPSGARVALLGAGGGAAAVCAAAEEWPRARVAIFSRSPERAQRLAQRFSEIARTASSTSDALRDATLAVNATPVGLRGEEMPVAPDAVPRDASVIDLAYRAGETPWVRATRAAGHAAADGLEMLITQGACAFERWFGFAPDIDAMRAALEG